jgi:hypothetical protein
MKLCTVGNVYIFVVLLWLMAEHSAEANPTLPEVIVMCYSGCVLQPGLMID